MPDALPDPCSVCGFNGSGLRAPDLVAALRSLGRRWERALAEDSAGVARAHAEAAVDGLLESARTIGAEIGRFGTRPEASAAGIAEAATATADALEGPDQPFERPGVQEAAVAAVHAGTHHLRLAEKALGVADDS